MRRKVLFCITQNGDARDFPFRRAERVGGLALQTGHGAQNLARDGRNDGNDHDGHDNAGGEHAGSGVFPLEKRQKSQAASQQGNQMGVQPRHHHKNSPQAEDDARHGGEQFDEHRERLAQPLRREFGEINRGRNADGHGDDERDGRRNERAEDERQRSINIVDGIPVAADEEMPAEFLQREMRSAKQFVADEDNQRKNRQRHGQRQPFEGVVAEVRPSFGGCRFQFRLLFRRSRGNETQAFPR